MFLEPDEAVQLSYGNSYLYGEKDLEALFARRRAESLEQKLKRLQSHPAYENLLKMRENTKASELKGDTVGGSKPTVFYEPQSERYLRTQGGGGLPNAERSITITKADVAKLRADKANEALATKLENNLEALTGDPAASGLIDDLLTRDYHLASAAKKSELIAPKNADEVVGNSRTPSDETVKSADEVAKSTVKITKAELQQQIDELEKLYHSKYYGEWAKATAGEQKAKLALMQKAINKANNEEQKLLAKKQTPSVKAKLNDVREIKAELEKQVNTLKKEISNTKKTQDEIENELENINKKRMELIKQRDSLESANAGMKAGFSTAEMPSTMLGGAAGHIAGSTAASSEYESEGGVAGAIIGALAGLTSPKAAAKIAAKMIAKKASKIELMPNMPFKEAQDKVQKDLMKYVGVDIKNADSGIVAQINNNGAKKIVSNDAIQKSRNNKFSAGEHLSVAQKTPELFKNATFIGRYDDIKNGESSVKILRFAKNIEVKGKNAVAIITAKESVDKDLKRIYSMELEELRKAELKFGNYDKTQTPASKPLISQDNGVVNSVAPIKDGANSTPKELLSQGGGGLKRGFSTQALNELMLGLGGGGANAMAEDDPNKKAEAFIKGFLAGFGGAKAASMLAKNAPKLAPQLARASEKMASDFPRLLNDRPDILGGVLGRMNNAKDKFSFIFGGEKAIGANKAKLEKARDMAKNGAKDDEIWAKTGWYKDIDGKWKFEINAKGGELNKSAFDNHMTKEKAIEKEISELEKTIDDWENTTAKERVEAREKIDELTQSKYKLSIKLGDFLDDEALYKAYPQFKDTTIKFTSIDGDLGTSFGGKILLNKNMDIAQMKSVLYHELQHEVQYVEDFGVGGTGYFDKAKIKELVEKHPNDTKLKQLYDEIENGWAVDEDNAFNVYQKLAGEAEARNVQARQAMLEKADKEAGRIISMIKDPQKAMRISKDLANVDEYVMLKAGNKATGAEHIKLRHTSDPNKTGYVSDDEISRLGENMRKFIIKHGEPYFNKENGNFVYEWVENGNAFGLITNSRSLSKPDIFNPTSKTLRAPATDSRSLQLAPFNHTGTSARDEIITFFSNRNLKTNGAYKFTNPELTWQNATLPNSQLPHPDKTLDIAPNERIIDSNGARIYEWENKEGVRFRVVADSSRRDATTAELPQPRATDDIITFYSDRNLNEPMNFKNPNLNSAISNIKGQELSMRESFSPELKASYDMRDKLLKSTNEVRASLSKKGKAELEKLAGSKDSKLSRDAQIMKTLENAKSNPARYAKLKKLYLDENGKVKDSIGLC